MKYSTIAILILIITSCQGQPNINKKNYKEVSWTVNFPLSYNIADSLLIDRNNKSSSGFLKTLFAIRQKDYNSFVATINPFKPDNVTWEESFEVSKQKMIAQIISMGSSNIKILDTSSSSQIIDNLKFIKFSLVTFYPAQKIKLNTTIYYRNIDNYDLVITIGYQDETIGKEYKNILLQSKFYN